MWIQTHSYLAKQIHQHIRSKYHLELHAEQLQYGSVKPDLHWSYRSIPHYYEGGFAHWLDEVGDLLKNSKYQDVKEFSTQLGIVLHFAADFFCTAHNDEGLKEHLWAHLQYELKLHRAFLNSDLNQENSVSKFGNPYAVVKTLRQKYLLQEPGLNRDIHYICMVALLLSDYFVEAVLLPAVKVA